MIKKILLSAILVVSAIQMSVGQVGVNATDNKQQPVTIIINSLAELIYEAATPDLSFEFENLGQLEGGIYKTAGTLKVRSNKNWRISASINYLNSELLGKEGFVFSSRVNGEDNESFVLDDQPKILINGSRGAGEENENIVGYHIKPGLNVDPGTYNVVVVYDLTQL